MYSYDWDTSGMSPGDYTLQAKAIDTAGNARTSDTRTVTIKPLNPPSVSITSPANGAMVSRKSTVSLTATASAVSPKTVTRVDFFVNGDLVCSVATSGDATCSWAVPAPPKKSYSLTATVYDSDGITAESNVIEVTSK